MTPFTSALKRRICTDLLRAADSVLQLVDVGAGGPLKQPWIAIPPQWLKKIDFEPDVKTATGSLPLCVSSIAGAREFHLAFDRRSSSLHAVDETFVRRFEMSGLRSERTIPVQCVTLDSYFAGRYAEIDAIDINVEGHDFEVLKGAARLFAEGSIKSIKIEFELASVWFGQGSLGDIDAWMRSHGYDLVDIEIDRLRPAAARRLYHPGEPVWGKAYYLISPWKYAQLYPDSTAATRNFYKLAALGLAFDAPGRVIEMLQSSSSFRLAGSEELIRKIAGVYRLARIDRGIDFVSQFASALSNRFRPYEI